MQNFPDILKKITAKREYFQDILLEYAASDTILFFDNKPDLADLQKQVWLPLVLWANQQTSADFSPSYSLTDEKTIKKPEAFKKYITSLDNENFAKVFFASQKLRSVILALSFIIGDISAQNAVETSFLEQIYNEKKWGVDQDALASRQEIVTVLSELKTFS